MKEKIILASASERRKDILNMLGIDFTISPADIDEESFKADSPSELVEILAYEKAKACSKVYSDGYIIGSDTIVYFDGEIILKPKHYDDAFRILKKLNNNTNYVYTGVCVLNAKTGEYYTAFDESEVSFKDNSDETIKKFIELDQPYDKSGSYSISGIGSVLIREIKGEFYSVLGLSVRRLTELFEKHGIKVI